MNPIEQWSNHLLLTVSPTTKHAYLYEIKRLAEKYPISNLLDLTTDDLTAHLAKIRSRIATNATKTGRNDPQAGLSSVYRATNALRAFYAFFEKDTANGLKPRKPAKRVQRTLTHEEANRLIYTIDTSQPIGRRNLAMITTMLDSGLRAAELCRLTIDHIDLNNLLIWTIVKGGQEAFGAISMETANYLSAWFATRPTITNCNHAFVAIKTGQPITSDGIRSIFHAMGKHANIKGLSPHVLRRTFATLSTLNGASTRIVQEAGRWNDLQQVLEYTKAITVEAIRPFLPVSGIMRGTQT